MLKHVTNFAAWSTRFNTMGFDVRTPVGLKKVLEELAGQDTGIWNGRKGDKERSNNKQILKQYFQDHQQRLDLGNNNLSTLKICAKAIGGATDISIVNQIRLIIANHAMDWFNSVGKLMAEDFQLWEDVKEIEEYCNKLTSLEQEPPELDVRGLLVFASYIQAPLHIYLYSSQRPIRVHPWFGKGNLDDERKMEALSEEDLRKLEVSNALPVAFLGMKSTSNQGLMPHFGEIKAKQAKQANHGVKSPSYVARTTRHTGPSPAPTPKVNSDVPWQPAARQEASRRGASRALSLEASTSSSVLPSSSSSSSAAAASTSSSSSKVRGLTCSLSNQSSSAHPSAVPPSLLMQQSWLAPPPSEQVVSTERKRANYDEASQRLFSQIMASPFHPGSRDMAFTHVPVEGISESQGASAMEVDGPSSGSTCPLSGSVNQPSANCSGLQVSALSVRPEQGASQSRSEAMPTTEQSKMTNKEKAKHFAEQLELEAHSLFQGQAADHPLQPEDVVYEHAMLALSDWRIQYSDDNQKQYVDKMFPDKAITEDRFREWMKKYPQFGTRCGILQGKLDAKTGMPAKKYKFFERKDNSWVERRALPCDDYYEMSDNVLAVCNILWCLGCYMYMVALFLPLHEGLRLRLCIYSSHVHANVCV